MRARARRANIVWMLTPIKSRSVRHLRVRLAGLLAVIVAICLTPTVARAAFPAAVERLSPSRSDLDIALVDASTGRVLPLPVRVNTGADELHPNVTPDMRRMAFERVDRAAGTVRVILVDLQSGQQADLFSAFDAASSPPVTLAWLPLDKVRQPDLAERPGQLSRSCQHWILAAVVSRQPVPARVAAALLTVTAAGGVTSARAADRAALIDEPASTGAITLSDLQPGPGGVMRAVAFVDLLPLLRRVLAELGDQFGDLYGTDNQLARRSVTRVTEGVHRARGDEHGAPGHGSPPLPVEQNSISPSST